MGLNSEFGSLDQNDSNLHSAKERTLIDRPTVTTSFGAPIPDNQNSVTAGPRGPMLMKDYQQIEKLA